MPFPDKVFSLESSGVIETEEVVKKSRFIARGKYANTVSEAISFVKEVGDPKASHNCWAYRSSTGEERCTDDGEPGGTAGRPILSAIQGESLVDTVVCVTRYYGGIKLGTGGLVRAYGGAARSLLRAATTQEVVPQIHCIISVPMSDVAVLYQALQVLGGEERRSSEEADSATAELRLGISFPSQYLPALEQKLEDLSRARNGGSAHFRVDVVKGE
jgi:uncharacterized YigZ family protein